MEIKRLYRYEREANRITVSTIEPDCEYTECFRLIADEGKLLANGEIETPCIDVNTTEGWTEIDEPIEEPEEYIGLFINN